MNMRTLLAPLAVAATSSFFPAVAADNAQTFAGR